MKKVIILIAISAISTLANAQSNFSNSKIFKEYLESAGAKSAKVTASYFAKNGTLELPFNESIGIPYKLVGHDSIEAAISGLIKNAPDFRISKIKIIMDSDDKVLAEYESEANLLNGRVYKQKYLAYAIIKDGKIELHKEYMNTIALVSAVFPNGLSDLIPKK